MEEARIRAVIEGLVQGVWYRESTRRQAQALGVKGWVRNCRDGSVELVAEGPKEKLNELLSWCRKGPPAARVERVTVYEDVYRGEFDSFYISR